jgi:hypothetical protein
MAAFSAPAFISAAATAEVVVVLATGLGAGVVRRVVRWASAEAAMINKSAAKAAVDLIILII